MLATLNELPGLLEWVRAQLTELDPKTALLCELAVEEAVVNAMKHGYKGEPGHIELEFSATRDALTFTVKDKAPAFDPLRHTSKPDEGVGLVLMRECMDELHYKRDEPYNILQLVKLKGSEIM